MKSCIIHYAEIGTKGANRAFFEKCLCENIRKLSGLQAERRFGSLVLKAGESAKLTRILSCIPGIANFSYATACKPTMKDMEKTLLKLAKKRKFRTFRITASRSDKKFPLNSMELNQSLGGGIWKLKKKVDLHNPETEFFVDVGKSDAFVYDEQKITDIVKTTKKLQGNCRIYFVPFRDAQNEIIVSVPDKYRMIVYRRVILRIAEKILLRENAKAFVTGDSLSQVASQTMHNLRCIYSASSYPVLAPLMGMDKQEIVDEAKRIGTYESSIVKYHDCCAFMVAKHPATRASLPDVEDMEKKLDIENMIKKALKGKEVVRV